MNVPLPENWSDLWKALERAVRCEMKTFPGSHGWDHVERVCALALHIGEREKADLPVLALAALLHDIGRREEQASKGRICHARIGAEKAERLLVRHGLPEPIREAVLECIRSHRFRGQRRPRSLEAKVLFDADKLDSIGAVGIGRAFLFAGEVGARLHNSGQDLSATASYSREDTAFREFRLKLVNVSRRMLTKTGQGLARQRHAFMVRFFDELESEVQGRR
jgi:uncharacterized protein